MAKIMIVEDDILIAKGISEIIKSRDSNISTTITGYASKALDYAILDKYDIFLIDIHLLDYSGLELAREIRNINQYKLTPIVFITAIPTRELLAFKEIHCYDYIIKPFKKERVTEIINTLIDHGIKRVNQEKYIRFDLKNYMYRVELDKIIFIESIYRKVKVVTIDEEIELSNQTLNKLSNELNDNFIRCHRGFMVNINYIYGIDKTNRLIQLESVNISIPIGRKYEKDLKEAINESV